MVVVMECKRASVVYVSELIFLYPPNKVREGTMYVCVCADVCG